MSMKAEPEPAFASTPDVVCEHDESCRLRLERYQHRLRALALEVSLSAEHERHRIAQGLHDDVGQSLAAARLRLDALLRRTNDPDVSQPIVDAVAVLGEAIESIRRLTFELRPPLLHELGIEAALMSLTDRMRTADGIDCRLVCDDEPTPLASDVSMVLYTVVRELLHNVIKHAHAESVRVVMKRDGACVTVDVTDDGIGFEPSHETVPFDSHAGFGLFSSRERLMQIGGALELESHPGSGTRVQLTAPAAAVGEATP